MEDFGDSVKDREIKTTENTTPKSNSESVSLYNDQSDVNGDELFAELMAATEDGRVDDVKRIVELERDLMNVGDPMGDTAFHIVARAGHNDVMLLLISIARVHAQLRRAMVDQNIDGDTALHLAIKNGHLQVVQSLIDESESKSYVECVVFMANNDGKYPRDLAEQYGYSDLAQFLTFIPGFGEVLIYVADIEMELRQRIPVDEDRKVVHYKWYDLRKAVAGGKEKEVMQILKEEPRLIRQIHRSLGSLLHGAAVAPEVGMLRKLVSFCVTNNPNPNPNPPNELDILMSSTDDAGDNPLHIAARQGKLSMAMYLTEVAPQTVYQVNHKGVSPMLLAIQIGHEDLLSFMIDQAQVSEPIKESLISHAKKASLPHAAIKANNIGKLRILMEKLPCLISSSDSKGWKPLSYAASKGHLGQINYLLTKFPSCVKKRDKDGSLPIHKAIAAGHIHVVKEIIAQFPNAICDVDRKGRSTLHIATRYRKADVLSHLLQERDSKKIHSLKDNEGKTFEDLLKELKIAQV